MAPYNLSIRRIRAFLLLITLLLFAARGDHSHGEPLGIQEEFISSSDALEFAILCQSIYGFRNESFWNFRITPPQYTVQAGQFYADHSAFYWIGNSTDKLILAFRGLATPEFVRSAEDEQQQVLLGPDGRAFNETMFEWNSDGAILHIPVLVHSQFNRDVFSVYDSVVEKLSLLSSQYSNKLHVTGHSLGGAHAALFSAYFAFHHPHINVSTQTFGQARCGNQGFKIFSESFLHNLNYWRLVYEKDVVPRVPFTNYQHAGHVVWREGDAAAAYYRTIGSTTRGLYGIEDMSVASEYHEFIVLVDSLFVSYSTSFSILELLHATQADLDNDHPLNDGMLEWLINATTTQDGFPQGFDRILADDSALDDGDTEL